MQEQEINLVDLLPAPAKINLGRGEVNVYGVTLTDLSQLINTYGKELNAFISDKPDFVAMINTLPELALQLIAMGLRLKGKEEQIKQIPLSIQIEILMEVWEASVPDSKKFKDKLGVFSAALTSLAQKSAVKSQLNSPEPLPLASTS